MFGYIIISYYVVILQLCFKLGVNLIFTHTKILCQSLTIHLFNAFYFGIKASRATYYFGIKALRTTYYGHIQLSLSFKSLLMSTT